MNVQEAIAEMDKGKISFCKATDRFYKNLQGRNKPTAAYSSSKTPTAVYSWYYRPCFNKKEILGEWAVFIDIDEVEKISRVVTIFTGIEVHSDEELVTLMEENNNA